MLRKNRNLEHDGCNDPIKTNYLDGAACVDWVREITAEKHLDAAWVLKDYAEPIVMTCIHKVVKLRPGYAEVAHYTIGPCCKEILGRDEVFCLRRKEGSEWGILTTHIAGECPILKYKDWDGREE